MIVTCEKCSAKYKLDPSKVSGRGAKITCPKCKHVFVVQAPAAQAEAPAEAKSAAVGGGVASPPPAEPARAAPPNVVSRPGAAPPPPPRPVAAEPKRSAEALDFRKVGIASWKVRVKIGLVYDFSDFKTLRKYITDGRVTSEDVISHDGRGWVTIGDIPNLEAYFVEVYEKAEAKQQAQAAAAAAPPSANDFGAEESPTNIIGMGNLGESIGAQALEAASNAAVADVSTSRKLPPPPAEDLDAFNKLTNNARSAPKPQPAPAKAPPKAPPVEAKSSSAPMIVGGVLLLALLGGAAWFAFGRQPEPTKPPPGPETTPVQSGPGEGAPDLKKQINETLKDAQQNRAPIEGEEDPVLIPVGPRDGGKPAGGKPSGGTSGGTSAASGGKVDASADCLALANQGSWSQAAMACGMAKNADPGNAKVLAAHGTALYNTGNKDDALSSLKAAERAGSKDPQIYKLMGHISRDQGDAAGAQGYYQKYLATNPGDKAAIQQEIQKLTGS